MALCWKDIFLILERAWELNQSKIAECLEVDRATISRYAHGAVARHRIRNIDFYEKLFDPEDSKSPVHGKIPKVLLRDLLGAIHDLGFSNAISELDTTEYRAFVMGLLKLVRANQPKKTSKCEKKPPVTDVNSAASKQPSLSQEIGIPESMIEDTNFSDVEGRDASDTHHDESLPDQLTLPDSPKFFTLEVMDQAINSPFGTLDVLKAQNEYFRRPLSPRRKKK